MPELQNIVSVLELHRPTSQRLRILPLAVALAPEHAQIYRQIWREVEGIEAALTTLVQTKDTFVVRVDIDYHHLKGVFFLECHTGKILTGLILPLPTPGYSSRR